MKRCISIIIISLLVLGGCAAKEPQTAPEGGKAKAGSSQPEQQVVTFNLAGYSKEQKKEWEINGKSADIEEQTVKLDGVKAQTFGKDTNFILTADKGEFDRVENKAVLQENVNAVVDDQKRSSKTVITCTGPLDIDYKNNFAVFNENVKVVDQQGTITSDKATVYFDTVSKRLKKIVMAGNVHIIQSQNESFCDDATYDAIESKITLSGMPKILISSEDGKFKGMGGLFGSKEEN